MQWGLSVPLTVKIANIKIILNFKTNLSFNLSIQAIHPWYWCIQPLVHLKLVKLMRSVTFNKRLQCTVTIVCMTVLLFSFFPQYRTLRWWIGNISENLVASGCFWLCAFPPFQQWCEGHGEGGPTGEVNGDRGLFNVGGTWNSTHQHGVEPNHPWY